MTPLVPTAKTIAIAAVAAVAIAALAAAVLSDRGAPIESTGSVAAGPTDRLDTELRQCRFVRPVETDAFEKCRRIWAENRKHFLSSDSPKRPQDAESSPFAEPARKKDNRVEQPAPTTSSRGD